MSRQGLKDELSRYNRFEILPVDLEESNPPNDILETYVLSSSEIDLRMRDSNDSVEQSFVQPEDHAHTKALIHYDGERLKSRFYPTRVFINSRYKRRKFLDQVVTSEPSCVSSGCCRSAEFEESPVESRLTPSGHITCSPVGLGGNAVFEIPSHTNVVDFTVSSAFIDTNERAKLDMFMRIGETSHSCETEEEIGDRHYHVIPGFDEYGEYTDNVSNSDILHAFDSLTHFDVHSGEEPVRVRVNRKRRAYRLQNLDDQISSKTTVLYIPHLCKIDHFLKSSRGRFFFYSNYPEELNKAIKLGLNVVVIHRHLYVGVCERFADNIQVIIIMSRDSYFDVMKVKNRLIILNPFNVRPSKILETLFDLQPRTRRSPISLLASLKVKFGCEI